MKVIVFNDTSRYHKGCEKVMEYLHKDLRKCGHEILESVKGNKDKIDDVQHLFLEADAVIVNGEGTMHHDRPVPHQLLQVLKNAKTLGKKTALVNTVWQSMTLDDEMKDVLRDTYISVREVMSARELQKDDIHVDINLDLSYFNDVPERMAPHREMVVGKFFAQQDYRPNDIPHIDIFKQDWDTIVNVLRSTDWFITGRHHEMYAACKARCPFATLDGNTHKNLGLMETAEVVIPVESPTLLHDRIPDFLARCKEHRMEYEKLFNWMERQPRFTFAGKL
jgi:polysaccharide pyruvyl transferase WcaK-like protein